MSRENETKKGMNVLDLSRKKIKCVKCTCSTLNHCERKICISRNDGEHDITF